MVSPWDEPCGPWDDTCLLILLHFCLRRADDKVDVIKLQVFQICSDDPKNNMKHKLNWPSWLFFCGTSERCCGEVEVDRLRVRLLKEEQSTYCNCMHTAKASVCATRVSCRLQGFVIISIIGTFDVPSKNNWMKISDRIIVDFIFDKVKALSGLVKRTGRQQRCACQTSCQTVGLLLLQQCGIPSKCLASEFWVWG